MPRVSDTKQRMVRSAAKLLRQQGYAATSWRQVVAVSDTPWGSQAHFFPGGKEQLATDALELSGATYARLLHGVLADAHPADAIATWIEVASAELERSGWAAGCPIATVALETAHQSDALGSACQQAFTSWHEAIAGSLVARGLPESEATSLAMLALASIEGGLLLARAARDAEPLRLTGHELVALLRDRVP